MKIAVIGSGISGMAAAYMLKRNNDVTLYEKNQTLGGHSRTIELNLPDGNVPVDTGFIVYNEKNYPHLTALFKHLGVATQKSDMSFGVSIDSGWLEYSSKGMFAQKRNLFRPQFWGMVSDILRFNQQALQAVGPDEKISLRQLLDRMNMREAFCKYYLQAMGAAIWSCSIETILDFPARTFLKFFENHGLLTVNGHPQWYTVTGGSREYIKKLTAPYQNSMLLNCGVVSVKSDGKMIAVTDTQGQTKTYNRVIFACHADQALKMLDEPTPEQRQVLSAFTYQKNRVIVHSDLSFMPNRKKCWASWVYLSESQQDHKPVVSLSYWMNNLQNLKTSTQVIVTLNPERRPAPDKIYDEVEFEHPVFTQQAIDAQAQIKRIQGQQNMYFCGAYQRYGFHEDGLLSAVQVVELLGEKPQWV